MKGSLVMRWSELNSVYIQGQKVKAIEGHYREAKDRMVGGHVMVGLDGYFELILEGLGKNDDGSVDYGVKDGGQVSITIVTQRNADDDTFGGHENRLVSDIWYTENWGGEASVRDLNGVALVHA